MDNAALLAELRKIGTEKLRDRIFKPTITMTDGKVKNTVLNPMGASETDRYLKELAAYLMTRVPNLIPTYGPIKAMDRAAQKVADDYGGDWYSLQDAVRMTFVCSSQDQLTQLAHEIKSVCTHGTEYRIIPPIKERKPSDSPCGYSDWNFKIAMPNGRPAEIQANTIAVLYGQFSENLFIEILGAAKLNEMKSTLKIEGGLGHGLYEAYRVQTSSKLGLQAAALAMRYWNYLREGKGVMTTAGDLRWDLKQFMTANPKYFHH